jgi:hypothetical protein
MTHVAPSQAIRRTKYLTLTRCMQQNTTVETCRRILFLALAAAFFSWPYQSESR